jgi:hypothetical protein
MGEGLVLEWTSFEEVRWKVATGSGQGVREGLVSEWTSFLGSVLEGRSRDWSENGGGTGLRMN